MRIFEPKERLSEFIGIRCFAETAIGYEGGVIYMNGKHVMAKTSSLKKKIRKGDAVLVVGYLSDEKLYLVERYI